MPHDIFVSYAHADDEAPGTARFGGVTTFVEELKKLLRKKLGGDGADIWMDHSLAANQRVQETLAQHVRGSRCILLFMSPGYLRSPWCGGELQQFLASNSASFHRENVFVVAIEETDRKRWPSRVQDLTPVELFEHDIKGVSKTLGWPYPPQDPESKYWSRLNELAHFIRSQLTDPDGDEGRPVADRTAATALQPRVWIAQATAELRDEWESLACAVRQTGAIVLPNGGSVYPEDDGAAFKLAVVKDLTEADMLVQLLGRDGGPALGSGPLDRSALVQHELARVLKGGEFTRLMRWRNAAAAGVLNNSEIDPYQGLLLGAVSGPFEQFRSLVVAEIERRMRPVAPVAPAAQRSDSLTVCVTASEHDRGLAGKVCELVQGLGAVPIAVGARPSPGQSQTEYREQFEELLGDVDGVILVHGIAPAMWLHSRYAQVRKVLAPRRRPVWGAFLDGPPQAKAEPVSCEGPGLLTLSCREGLNTGAIQQFLGQLQPANDHV